MPTIGPVAVYDLAVAKMKAAYDALISKPSTTGHCGNCCTCAPSPEWTAWIMACRERDEARRNLPVDAEDVCDRPFLSGQTGITLHPKLPKSFAVPD